MTSWTRRTAKTILLTAGIAAAATALPAAAFASTNITSGNGSLASGNQVNIPITIPINVCGNAAALLGVSTAACDGGASVTGAGDSAGSMRTSGDHSTLSGNQVSAPITAPVDVCGNAIGGGAKAHCTGGATVRQISTTGTEITSGDHSVLSGNQVTAPVTAPVDVCGNSVAILGVAGAGCEGGATVDGTRVTSTPWMPRNWMPRNWEPQCKCQGESNGITSLLPDYTAALGSVQNKLTAYTDGSPLGNLPALPVVSSLPGLTGGLTSLPALGALPGSGEAA
jgi:hypothetical protein